ncbi:CAAX prenyl protease [Meloidogyne graminicola]|uniref:Ste24 endopeptidase n=1 Tax=Meloidogyne graminicola TaxID=189291 RepID=A0A8S9ZEF0_9BILA|nr:CAAX prenyl protease [Meloidogyne graminicola]
MFNSTIVERRKKRVQSEIVAEKTNREKNIHFLYIYLYKNNVSMDPTAIFWVLYSFYLTSFLWNFYLTLRQYIVYRKNETRPTEVNEIISDEDFKKARNYNLDKMHFGFYEIAFGKIITTIILFCNLIPWLWAVCGQFGQVLWPKSGEIVQSVIFILFSSIFETVTELPFSYYETFYVEQKHGFNKEVCSLHCLVAFFKFQTVPFFFMDRSKKLGLSLLITSPIVAAVVWIVHWGGQYFYIYVWAFVSIFIFLMMFIYPEFIAPLFDKYTPLPESELKTKIEDLANQVKFPLKKIYVVEGSKRSSHSNAYMYGFWKNKRIVLYDTLLSEEMNKKLKEVDQKTTDKSEASKNEDKNTEESNLVSTSEGTNQEVDGSEQKNRRVGMADDEIVAVLGHELGHWHDYHSVWLLFFTELNLLILLFVFAFFYRQPGLYLAFGFPASAYQPVLIGILLVSQFVLAPYNEILSVAISFVTRRFEFGADAFAARLGFTSQLCTGLVKLGKDNLSLPINDWLYSACNHSHPPILERIESLKKYK